MMRYLPMVLLVLGVGLAGVSGARNGPRHNDFRAAQARVGELVALQAELASCEDEPCRAEALAPRRASGLIADGQSPQDAIAQAEAARDAIGLPEPGERLAAWFGVGGLPWLLGVALIGVGAVLARRQAAAEASGESDITEERVHFPAVVHELIRRVAGVQTAIQYLGMDDSADAVRHLIEELESDLILPVVDARGQMIAKHGIGDFAEYFGPFSGAERNLARVWSALTDGHAPTARDAVASSLAGFRQAAEAWDRVEQRHGNAPFEGTLPEVHLSEADVAHPPRGMAQGRLASEAVLGVADLHGDEARDEETISDQETVRSAPDAEERELTLAEKEDLRALLDEAEELLEELVFVGFDVDDSDAVVDALHKAVERVRGSGELPKRWDRDTAGRLLGLLWGEHVMRVGGWRWVRLMVVGLHDGLAVVSADRSHALFPEAHVSSLVYDDRPENTTRLVYEMVRDRKVLPSAPGTRMLLS